MPFSATGYQCAGAGLQMQTEKDNERSRFNRINNNIILFYLNNQESRSMVEKLKPLPDIVKKNLRILFVGTSPGVRSSQIGHYFAGKSNVFWRLLHESGLTKERLTTEKDKKLLRYGYGLTDVVKTPTRNVSEIKQHYTIKSTRRLNRTMNMFKPKIAAFVGKTGFRIYSHDNYSKLEYGFQYKYKDVRIYLVPSSSGQSYRDTKYDEKLELYKTLKRYRDSIK